jgi:hypothetical protein
MCAYFIQPGKGGRDDAGKGAGKIEDGRGGGNEVTTNAGMKRRVLIKLGGMAREWKRGYARERQRETKNVSVFSRLSAFSLLSHFPP